jgi:hypothetical protein
MDRRKYRELIDWDEMFDLLVCTLTPAQARAKAVQWKQFRMLKAHIEMLRKRRKELTGSAKGKVTREMNQAHDGVAALAKELEGVAEPVEPGKVIDYIYKWMDTFTVRYQEAVDALRAVLAMEGCTFHADNVARFADRIARAETGAQWVKRAELTEEDGVQGKSDYEYLRMLLTGLQNEYLRMVEHHMASFSPNLSCPNSVSNAMALYQFYGEADIVSAYQYHMETIFRMAAGATVWNLMQGGK